MWLHVAGELDLLGAPILDEALQGAVLRAKAVILDLRELTFMDSSGVNVIVSAARRAIGAERRLTVVRGRAQIDHVMTITGAWRAVDTVDLPRGGPQGAFVISRAGYGSSGPADP